MNTLFLSCLKPLFHSKAKCKAIDIKIFFYFHANKTHFYNKGFALRLLLRVRVSRTQEWPIESNGYYMTYIERVPFNVCI